MIFSKERRVDVFAVRPKGSKSTFYKTDISVTRLHSINVYYTIEIG